MNNIKYDFLQYLEYLYSQGKTLDENGNVVNIEELNEEELKLEKEYE